MTDAKEIVCRLALMSVKGLGLVSARTLIKAMGTACAVYENIGAVQAVSGLGHAVVDGIKSRSTIPAAEKELDFALKNGVDILLDTDSHFPARLRECADAPLLLFFKGNADLNNMRVVSIVGTRNVTDYGRSLCRRFVADLGELCPGTLVVSGLAYGVDIEAHRAALEAHLPTVGVLAHGLDRIYPFVHRHTADEMIACGGLLTEYSTGTNPDRPNFVCRNRIVAGMADAVVVIESAEKGGALITAGLANGYCRECFAFPGRVGDKYSEGCNKFISENKAALIQSAEDFVENMLWKDTKNTMHKRPVQKQLFADLTPDEEKVVDILRSEGDMQINALVLQSGWPVSKLSPLLFSLEMKGAVSVGAGSVYRLELL